MSKAKSWYNVRRDGKTEPPVVERERPTPSKNKPVTLIWYVRRPKFILDKGNDELVVERRRRKFKHVTAAKQAIKHEIEWNRKYGWEVINYKIHSE